MMNAEIRRRELFVDFLTSVLDTSETASSAAPQDAQASAATQPERGAAQATAER